MKLCWCDRIGVGWSIVVLGLLAMMGAFSEAPHVDPGHNLTQALYVFVLPIWGLLRVIDLMGGGPWARAARRRGDVKATLYRP